MNKEQIIAEIQRTAKANGGKALGAKRFESETEIGRRDWYPDLWIRWSDAVREAGLAPNRMNEAYAEEFLLEKLVILTRRLGHVPVHGELLFAARNEPGFPSKNAFARLGSRSQRVSQVIAFCGMRPEYSDVGALWRQVAISEEHPRAEDTGSAPPTVGYVYLIKHGSRREYKIGRTYNPLRREGEVGIELPERIKPVHYIETDDPAGVEAYWHNRFSNRRKEGEWFALSQEDVRAFKRWKRIF